MDDLIRRRAAIDAICDNCDTVEASCPHYPCSRYVAVENLPPEERDYKFNEWCTDCKEYDHERHCCPRFNQVIRTTLQEVQEERKNGEWIPCSERLPEEGKEVLISSDSGLYIAELEIFEGNAYWNETIEYRSVKRVSAWMPLPEPYEERKEE